MPGYEILKPKTAYSTEEDYPNKFDNLGDDIDKAIADIISSGEEFTPPNVELLHEAIKNTPSRRQA